MKDESCSLGRGKGKGILSEGTASAQAWGLKGVCIYNTSGSSLLLKQSEGCVGGGIPGKMGALA